MAASTRVNASGLKADLMPSSQDIGNAAVGETLLQAVIKAADPSASMAKAKRDGRLNRLHTNLRAMAMLESE